MGAFQTAVDFIWNEPDAFRDQMGKGDLEEIIVVLIRALIVIHQRK